MESETVKGLNLSRDKEFYERDLQWFKDNSDKEVEIASLDMIKKGKESYKYPTIVVNDLDDLKYITELMNRMPVYARVKHGINLHEILDTLKVVLLKVIEIGIENKFKKK